MLKVMLQLSVCLILRACVRVCAQNAEVTRQMTVARVAQDEVEEVRREMQEKVKAAQETADRQVKQRRIDTVQNHQKRS